MKRSQKIFLSGLIIAAFVLGGLLVNSLGGLPGLDKLNQTAVEEINETYKDTATAANIQIGPSNIADMVDRVSPAVVNIETTTKVSGSSFYSDPFFRDFFGDNMGPQSQEQKGIGTGSIISADGYILTNYHVVEGASSVNVKLVGFSKALTAKVIGYDNDLDLAILKVNAGRKLPYLVLGNSDSTRVGEWVVAIGNPYGLDHTVTAGVISAKERPITIENRQYKNLFQTDAAINPGNSGGPLLNTSGQVIAINTAVNASAQGIGFAIPINVAKEVLDDLIDNGKVARPYIGVYLRDVSDELSGYLGAPDSKGALVAEIMPNSPASKAGLRKGDIILAVNGKSIADSSALTTAISKYEIGDQVTLKVFRDRKTIEVKVILAEKP